MNRNPKFQNPNSKQKSNFKLQIPKFGAWDLKIVWDLVFGAWNFRQRGSILVATLVFSAVFMIMAGGLLGYVSGQRKLVISRQTQVSALEVAEAGINYYRWHLAHAGNDFADGTGQTGCSPCGPYTHSFTDPSGSVIGQFVLEITPPPPGSTIVKIKSTGSTTVNPQTKRRIIARYGRPSLSAYAVLANANMRFGSGTTVNGPIHVNGGIRFDGLARNVVTSAQQTYDDTDYDACTVNSWGAHTCLNPADPAPPTAPPQRLDVFMAGRNYPVPTIDFNAITLNLGQMQTEGRSANGFYLNKSNQAGWHVQFLNNGTFRYRRVRTTRTCSSTGTAVGDIYQYSGNWASENLPSNGILFVEDNAWVDGTIQSNGHATVVAAKEPLASGNAIIWINNDILYATQNSSTTIGLVAQKDISVGLFSENDLEIDAAMLAQTGRVGRPYYTSSCSSTYYRRNSITVNGTIASNQRYGFAYTDGTGYQLRYLNFDSNLTYAPPPSFPTSGTYEFISWEEVAQ